MIQYARAVWCEIFHAYTMGKIYSEHIRYCKSPPHHITSHYLTLPHITLHYLTLPHITSHYLTLPYITSQDVTIDRQNQLRQTSALPGAGDKAPPTVIPQLTSSTSTVIRVGPSSLVMLESLILFLDSFSITLEREREREREIGERER